MTEEQARELLLTNYLYYGVMMVKMKDADGMVSGACHSTADTLRPCPVSYTHLDVYKRQSQTVKQSDSPHSKKLCTTGGKAYRKLQN